MTEVLLLTEGTTVPASRLRVGQFIPHFEERGIDCTVRAGYGEMYNRVSQTALGTPYKLLWRLKRVVHGLRAGAYDVVFVQRPALPFTALPERLISRLNPNVIFDVDDAIFLGPGGRVEPARRRTFDDELEIARHVICGNHYLAEMAPDDKTTMIPTVIDTDKYVPAEAAESDSDGVIIGWMGTSGNFPFLEQVTPVLKRVLDARAEATVRLVSNAAFEPLAGHPQVEQPRWSEERELELLQSFDIGLMPLEDSELTRGKCGFKMIQYMAVGVPVVASAVGANVDIFEGSGAGHLPDSWEDWEQPLLQLIDDADEREQRGSSGREHCVENYSIRGVLDVYLEIFDSLADT